MNRTIKLNVLLLAAMAMDASTCAFAGEAQTPAVSLVAKAGGVTVLVP